jgi:amino acid transporter
MTPSSTAHPLSKVPMHETPEALRRTLSVAGLWLLVVNGMIGAGIFGLPAEATRLVGAASPLVFLFCGLLIAPVMLAFAELSSRFEGTGGPVAYTRAAFGSLVSFQVGWAFYVARATALAANLNLLIATLAFFVPGADAGATRLVALAVILITLTALNVLGSRQAIGSVGVLTVLKLAPLLAVVVWGAPELDRWASAVVAVPVPEASDWSAATLLLLYAFVGFESGLIPAGEARQPGRDIPRALLVNLALVTVLYVLIQAVSFSVLPDLGASERPLVDVAARLFGETGAVLMTVGVIASVGGNLAGAMFTTPRMTYALALDGHLPRIFAWVHPVWRTPTVSVAVFGAIVLVLAATGSFAWLAATSVLIRLLVYLACIAAMPRLRREFGMKGRSIVVPVLSAVLCTWLLLQVSVQSVVATAALIAAGLALYGAEYLRRRR